MLNEVKHLVLMVRSFVNAEILRLLLQNETKSGTRRRRRVVDSPVQTRRRMSYSERPDLSGKIEACYSEVRTQCGRNFNRHARFAPPAGPQRQLGVVALEPGAKVTAATLIPVRHRQGEWRCPSAQPEL